VRHGVEPHLYETLLEVRVPEVLDLVVRPPRQARRDLRPPEKIRSQTQTISALNPTYSNQESHSKFPWLQRRTYLLPRRP
jgi:putative hemolysin